VHPNDAAPLTRILQDILVPLASFPVASMRFGPGDSSLVFSCCRDKFECWNLAKFSDISAMDIDRYTTKG
jgi:hypothetical protein